MSIGEHKSEHANRSCGVPQGSVLGPPLFTMCMVSLGNIMRGYDIRIRYYADDTQLYCALKTQDTQISEDCVRSVKSG